MASLTKTVGKRGTTWRVDFFLGDDPKRRHIRLGKMDKRRAESIRSQVEFLITAKITGTAPPPETSQWVASREDELYRKLAKHGLVAPRAEAASSTLAAFLDRYIEGRTDVKPNTRAHLKRARNNLVDYFGAEKSLSEITPGDADDFRVRLGQTLADNTVRRVCGRAKQFFRAAVRKRLIAESPFADMKGTGVRANKSREHFVTREVAEKVLAACPDPEWKLLFALSRYGGLRCPSEHLALCWSDVDWDLGRITVRSPKTEHHEGKEFRTIPLFPELRVELQKVADKVNLGKDTPLSAPIITRYRDRNSNLRTQLERIIRKADLKPWPKLFQNLRATRETELAEEFPIHVVCDWIGNTQAVATKHYLQTTDEHFTRATEKAQQKAQQSASEGRRYGRKAREGQRKNSEGFADPRNKQGVKAPPVGLEPRTQRLTAACSTN